MDSLISQGINLAIFGMGTVFLFLTLLIFATGLMSYLVTRFSAEKPDSDVSNDLDLPPAKPNQLTIAIITAALREHRRISADRRS
ncbi:MAG: oxaloacetate decarboxylase gamma subunit [Pseudohongiellaceae bacterium]|jgi:oxaloacetate decarboxylase gamma subunit